MSDLHARYSRQILFPRIGEDGQRRLREATIGLVGLGALGSTLAETAVRAGVGRLVAVDRDVIEPSNLHRQGLYTHDDATRNLPKAVAARERLEAMNPDVRVEAEVADFGPDNAHELFADCDVILDGTDSFETRYLINDLAVDLDRPWIYGACLAAMGMTATIIPGRTPCLTCLFPDPPPAGTQETCDTAGIIAPAAQMVAAIQMAEALKILTGHAEDVRPSLLSIELWPFKVIEIGARGASPRADCRTCGQRRLDFLEGARRARWTTLCGRNSVQITPTSRSPIALDELAERLRTAGEVRRNDYVVTLDVDGFEISVFGDGRALVKGTTDVAQARTLYARYVGA